MATNQIAPFATGVGANVQDLATYLAAASTAGGYSAGIAQSQALNRTWRQSSFVAAACATWLANLGIDVLDNGDVTSLAAKFRQTMGNASGLSVLSASGVIPPSTAGQVVIFNANNATATLPLISAVAPGATLKFMAANVSGCLISLQGADSFVTGVGASSGSLPLGRGDTATFVAGPGGWYLIGGTLSEKYSASFAASISTNGYQTFPSGVILQKGQILCPAANTFYTFSFPIAFPNSGGSTTVIVSPISGAPLAAPAVHDTPTSNSVRVSAGAAGGFVDIIAIGN